jgi:hypothetical protein
LGIADVVGEETTRIPESAEIRARSYWRLMMAKLIRTAAVLIAIGIVLSSGYLHAQDIGQTKEMWPGWVRQNLGEGPSNVPGFYRVRVVEDTIQPGAGQPSLITMPVPMFCTLLEGELSVSIDGEPPVRVKAGDSWVCVVGQKRQATSTGSEPAVMRMHHLLKVGDM